MLGSLKNPLRLTLYTLRSSKFDFPSLLIIRWLLSSRLSTFQPSVTLLINPRIHQDTHMYEHHHVHRIHD